MARDLGPAAGASLRVTQVISAALSASVPIYGAVAALVIASAPPVAEGPPAGPAGTAPELMRLVLAAVAAPSLVLALAWPLLMRRRVAAPGGEAQDPEAALRRFRIHVIIRAALAESVAVYGLLLALINRSLPDFVLFAIPAFAVLVWLFPTRGRLESFLAESGKSKQ